MLVEHKAINEAKAEIEIKKKEIAEWHMNYNDISEEDRDNFEARYGLLNTLANSISLSVFEKSIDLDPKKVFQ